MKILVTGANGQLGSDLVDELNKRGLETIATGAEIESQCDVLYEQMDITDEEEVNRVITKYVPNAVIHCAAWTAVDLAEEPENKEKVYDINTLGTKFIAQACKKINAKMLYISTDYIFDGSGEKPWKEDCNNYKPINYYGETKLGGELEVAKALAKFFIVRIAWVFGANGSNFVKTMLKLGREKDTLSVVCDQIGTPTYTPDLAVLLADMITSDKYGYYHATNDGEYISWYDFAVQIFEYAFSLGYDEYGKDKLKINPVTAKQYGLSKAERPKNSRLCRDNVTKNGFCMLPDWKDAMQRYVKQIISTV